MGSLFISTYQRKGRDNREAGPLMVTLPRPRASYYYAFFMLFLCVFLPILSAGNANKFFFFGSPPFLP